MNFFLFYGPPGSGKSLMVRALAKECDATVIEISPTTFEGTYADKSGPV